MLSIYSIYLEGYVDFLTLLYVRFNIRQTTRHFLGLKAHIKPNALARAAYAGDPDEGQIAQLYCHGYVPTAAGQ